MNNYAKAPRRKLNLIAYLCKNNFFTKTFFHGIIYYKSQAEASCFEEVLFLPLELLYAFLHIIEEN